MAKYAVYGKVEGSIYLGEYEAPDAETAMQIAEEENGQISFCHSCAGKCEDPTVTATDTEERP